MKIGIIYGKKSGIMRRIIEPDDEREFQLHRAEGEEILIVDRGDGPLIERSLEALKAHLGREPADPRCEVLDERGKVVSVIMADPELDRVPGHILRRLVK